MANEEGKADLSDEEKALVDELITNRIPLPGVLNIETLQAALDASRTPAQIEFVRGRQDEPLLEQREPPTVGVISDDTDIGTPVVTPIQPG